MKLRIRYIFLLIIVSTTFNSLISQDNIDSILYWDNCNVLTWDLFNGEPWDSTDFGAASYIGIDVETSFQSGLPYLSIRTSFSPIVSWKKIPSDPLLIHEQGHFDLAEVYSRRIRKEVDQLRNSNNTNFDSYFNIYDSLYSTYRQESGKYDFETDYGKNLEIQGTWNRKLKLQLHELNMYKFKILLE